MGLYFPRWVWVKGENGCEVLCTGPALPIVLKECSLGTGGRRGKPYHPRITLWSLRMTNLPQYFYMEPWDIYLAMGRTPNDQESIKSDYDKTERVLW